MPQGSGVHLFKSLIPSPLGPELTYLKKKKFKTITKTFNYKNTADNQDFHHQRPLNELTSKNQFSTLARNLQAGLPPHQ